VPEALRSRVEAGDLGRKSGEGFYRYDRKGKPDRGKPGLSGSELDALGRDLVEPLLEEAERCRDEGVVADGDLVDAGAVFGCGFAPFTGGPLHYRSQSSGTAAS
jgi:3-hydroxyacyl-CoA dehydrogenase/enoyl-CoA hydratase/3-hydroxybutyryl-CoA epimerase